MAITKSAKKAHKQSLKKQAVNTDFEIQMKRAIKIVKKIKESGDTKNLTESLVHAQQRIDKAAKRNIISKTAASRRKSVLMRTSA